MNNRIRQLVDQITELESELNTLIDEQESRLRYQVEGRRVVFEQTLREAHRRVKMGVFRWFLTVRPQNYLTMPVIYGAAVPLALFDKHARKVCAAHSRYERFLAYGEGDDFHLRLEEYRSALARERETGTTGKDSRKTPS